jgi:hypothetical protein
MYEVQHQFIVYCMLRITKNNVKVGMGVDNMADVSIAATD